MTRVPASYKLTDGFEVNNPLNRVIEAERHQRFAAFSHQPFSFLQRTGASR